LTREEILSIPVRCPGLEIASLEDFTDDDTPPVRRFRVELVRRR
jgi:hypothetical protein